MRALTRKLERDVFRLWAQALTIALVVASGVAGFVSMFSTHTSLLSARDRFYAESHFAQVFAVVKRAPAQVSRDVLALPGVDAVQTWSEFDTQITIPGVIEPLTGRLVGLPTESARTLNRVTLTSGQWPVAEGDVLEVLAHERFAEVRQLQAGSTLVALLNGRLRTLRISGTAIAPDYVHATRGGGPDDGWFGVFWVPETALVHAFDLRGAFNQLALTLRPGFSEQAVIQPLEWLLEPYGALTVHGRDLQLSDRIIDNELQQQKVLATLLPAILLAVAVFILNSVLARQVSTQRQQIATLKALGYRDREIVLHYLQLALAIATLGLLMGYALSAVLGRGLVAVYADVFRFGNLLYQPDWRVLAAAAALVWLSAALGAWMAIRAVVSLAPAQAMLPPAPAHYRPLLLQRLGLGLRIHPAAAMVLRNLERRPWRSLLTSTGMAAAVALQITGLYWNDTIAHLIDMQFRQVQQADVLLDFSRPVALHEAHGGLQRLPGVQWAEIYRNDAVRLHARGQSLDTVITGLAPAAQLMRLVDAKQGPISLEARGLQATGILARALGLQVGDAVQIEFRSGSRREVTLTIEAIVETYFGKQLYLPLDELARLAGDGAAASQAALRVDPNAREAFFEAVRQTPVISSVFDKEGMLRSFEEQTKRNLSYFTTVLTLFAVAMAIGITYNAARIGLAERAWELASLRILGMRRAEVSWLLLAELGVCLAIALPLGCITGLGLAHLMMAFMESDEIAFPVVISAASYTTACLTVIASGILSALIVRRRIDRLDLIAVLKERA